MTTNRRTPRNAVARTILSRESPELRTTEREALRCADAILAALAEHHRAEVVRRLREGREAKRAEGGGWLAGNPPYGWRSRGLGRLEPVAAEQRVLAWMGRQRAEGYSWASIAARLNEAGTPGPKGGRWHVSSVRRIVERGTQNPAFYAPSGSKGEG